MNNNSILSATRYDNALILDELPQRRMSFYIEGIRCASCIQSLEKIPSIISGVRSARLNFPKGLLEIELESTGKFSEVTAEIRRQGYVAHPIKNSAKSHAQAERRQDLLRLGIAGACAGNIMLLTVSLYSGATGDTALAFGWLACALSLPALSFSAWPFYQSSWNALRNKTISIDQPIAAALLTGLVVSVVELLHRRPNVYFDSLSMLVFLLLASRLLLKRIQQSQASTQGLLQFLDLATAIRIDPTGQQQVIKIADLNLGDLVYVEADTNFPADGIVKEGESLIDCALLTGESEPVSVQLGESVYAGTKNISAPLTIQIDRLGSTSRLGKILEQIQNAAGQRTPLVSFADRIAHIFVGVVGLLAAGVFLYFIRTSPEEGLRRALALVIVACPCVLALAVPLVSSLAITLAARLGTLIKTPEVFERLNTIQTVFLDKTGTLTWGRFALHSFTTTHSDIEALKAMVLALETPSRHPLARALLRELRSSQDLPSLSGWQETFGQGVRANYQNSVWELRRSEQTPTLKGAGQLTLYRDGVAMAELSLSDQLRPGVSSAVIALKKLGLQLNILSGDHPQTVAAIAQELKIDQALGGLSPEQKQAIVAKTSHSLMLGDGANDAIALQRADVGIAVHGSAEMSLAVADVFISRPGLQPVLDLLVIARESQRLIYRNFAISFFYNLIGGSLALAGFMNPLWAALLMPLSASSVFISSVWATPRLRQLKKERQ